MSSTYGEHLKVTLFGQSHGAAIGVVIEGLPAGMEIDQEALSHALARRAPGRSDLSTPRKETDQPEFLSGVMDGVLTGQPLCAVIRNHDQHSRDYSTELDLLRPGHADYTGHIRYFGFEDWRGGGSFSGRLTAPIVLAGALCAQFLREKGIRIFSHISRLGAHQDERIETAEQSQLEALSEMTLPTLSPCMEERMAETIREARRSGDSVGGSVTCRVDGLPAGLGAPFFGSVESELSRLLFSIPGVKAVAFGDGFAFAEGTGSEMNDAFTIRNGQIRTATNHSGGINGGITNGMPLLFTCAVRPTPTIASPQRTVSIRDMEEREISARGRHDPCILPRVCPVVEAMAAIGLTELWKERAQCLSVSPTRG